MHLLCSLFPPIPTHIQKNIILLRLINLYSSPFYYYCSTYFRAFLAFTTKETLQALSAITPAHIDFFSTLFLSIEVDSIQCFRLKFLYIHLVKFIL
ncbi:unnamed protein product [Phytomonas sp. EM1]|nr:unnamed protein product [Phytomonas sp. EM1]|eukprot:CCW61459.1 unnamed protein product [Phytomonas sp. isolate EM1]